jgi:hypothetical protein
LPVWKFDCCAFQYVHSILPVMEMASD